MSGDQPTPAARAELERDEFLSATLPALFGPCVRRDEGAWCEIHNTYWRLVLDRCEHIREMDDFGDRLIEAWEGRAS